MILRLFLLSWVALLYSCEATLHTPRHVRSGIIIEGQTSGYHKSHGELRRERRDHRQRDEDRH